MHGACRRPPPAAARRLPPPGPLGAAGSPVTRWRQAARSRWRVCCPPLRSALLLRSATARHAFIMMRTSSPLSVSVLQYTCYSRRLLLPLPVQPHPRNRQQASGGYTVLHRLSGFWSTRWVRVRVAAARAPNSHSELSSEPPCDRTHTATTRARHSSQWLPPSLRSHFYLVQLFLEVLRPPESDVCERWLTN